MPECNSVGPATANTWFYFRLGGVDVGPRVVALSCTLSADAGQRRADGAGVGASILSGGRQ